ncbi:MAG TPA: ABC transporter permease [Acidisoma sp.]|jgi:simple sugar transport system permease protein|uniref:ABC transporter permease n=1 Tax=Acidisoma sp. TaxID=1872115 RepID=UPI002B591D1B|nr:ABC transporter permease [Acidisoma sp.]HTI01284.1 ABC transporter permease [Acidisoma sp.]
MPEFLKRGLHSHEGKLLLVVLALIVFLSVATPSFFTLQNLVDLLTSYAFSGMLAAGLLVVLISGGIDISFTASASVAQYVAMTVANAYHIGWLGVIGICGGVGIACGLLNALLIGTLGLSSIIVTIATLNVFFGLLMFATHGNEIFSLPDWFVNGASWVVYTDKNETPYAFNLQMLGLISAFVLTAIILTRTNIGRQIYALGSNKDAAQRVGIKVFRINLLVYGYMGFVAGMASLIQAQDAQSVSPNALVGRELDVLAAVVLGGASLTGGVGTVSGTILGVMLLACLENGLLLLGVPSYWSQCFTGAVILIAVSALAIERQRHRAAARRVMA